MSESIYSTGFFNNPDIHFKDKIALLAILNHGTPAFTQNRGNNVLQVIVFNPDRSVKGVITDEFKNNDCMAKNNAKASVSIMFDGRKLATKSYPNGVSAREIFADITESHFNVSDESIFEFINGYLAAEMSSEGLLGNANKFIKPSYETFMEHLKRIYPSIVSDGFKNELFDKYIETIENSKKKQPMTSELPQAAANN